MPLKVLNWQFNNCEPPWIHETGWKVQRVYCSILTVRHKLINTYWKVHHPTWVYIPLQKIEMKQIRLNLAHYIFIFRSLFVSTWKQYFSARKMVIVLWPYLILLHNLLTVRDTFIPSTSQATSKFLRLRIFDFKIHQIQWHVSS